MADKDKKPAAVADDTLEIETLSPEDIRSERLARREDILSRITGSGEVTDPDEAVSLAKEIETYEWGDGVRGGVSSRRERIVRMMGAGRVKMRDIIKTVDRTINNLGSDL